MCMHVLCDLNLAQIRVLIHQTPATLSIACILHIVQASFNVGYTCDPLSYTV